MCRVLFSGPRVNIVLRLCRLSRLDHPLQEAVDVSSEKPHRETPIPKRDSVFTRSPTVRYRPPDNSRAPRIHIAISAIVPRANTVRTYRRTIVSDSRPLGYGASGSTSSGSIPARM